jgi:hypothetical protein
MIRALATIFAFSIAFAADPEWPSFRAGPSSPARTPDPPEVTSRGVVSSIQRINTASSWSRESGIVAGRFERVHNVVFEHQIGILEGLFKFAGALVNDLIVSDFGRGAAQKRVILVENLLTVLGHRSQTLPQRPSPPQLRPINSHRARRSVASPNRRHRMPPAW